MKKTMMITREVLTKELDNDFRIVGILASITEQILYIPIEIKNNPNTARGLYSTYKVMYPNFKEVIIW